LFKLAAFCGDHGKRARGLVNVEMSGQWDFITDFGFAVVDPGIGNVG
jgi:hypothetical protein